MRTAATLRAPGSGSTLLEARLTLAEFLLGSDELGPCAERTLQWLAANLGLPSSLCLLLEPARAQLAAISSYGLSLDSSEYAVELEPGNHPLAGAVAAGEPVFFPAGRVTNTPLGRNAFWAVPIGGRHPPAPLARGLVLIGTAAKELDPQAVWALELLGEKFDRLRHSGRVSEVEASDERALFMSLLNAVTDPILLTDAEGKVIVANSLAERLFLADEKDSEGRRRAVSLNNLLFSSALASQVGEKNEPRLRNELSLVDPNEGSDLLFELLSSPVRQPNGQTVVVSVLRNITDLGRASRELGENYRQLRQAQAEARHERLRLDLVIDSVADPIVVTDPEGDIVLMNAPAERFFTAPSTSEEAMRKVRHNDAHLSSFLSKSFLTDDAPRFRDELSLVDPVSGVTVPMEAVAGKVRSDTGELTTLLTILHDRTEALEKARLYEQLKEASSELEMKVQAATSDIVKQNELLRRQAIALEQASAAKSQFLANMSHEFRTPLNAILGYTNMLLQGVSGELNPPQKKNLMRVDSNGRHLLQVINEILDITRIEAGRMPLHLAEFALPELIAEVIAELEPIIARSTLQVLKELPDKLPKILGDRQKVKQILLNLMSNALKFTHQGSVRVKVKVMPGRRQLAIAVVDTGIGIAPADHQKVFEDFQQVDASTTRAYGGTGLGLAICRRLAQMMDGNITLESELGKGSTFTLYVPTRPRRK